MRDFSAVAALKHRNFRLFWAGQCISLIGTWMQNVAQAWLVLEITKSAFWLGVVSAVQFLPVLVLSLYAGTLIDRFPKKQMLIFTQTTLMVLAFILAVDTWMHTVALWHVLILAGVLGIANTLDMPTRQAFMIELVGREDLMNAIVLNSSIFNAARVVGPTVAGMAIAGVGIDWCFFINAVSFLPVITGITMIRLSGHPTAAAKQEKTGVWPEIRAGLSYVRNTPGILMPILILAVVNVFTMNFNVVVPLYAKDVFHSGAGGFGFLMSANGLGALIGAAILAAKSRNGPSARTLVAGGVGIGIFELAITPMKSFAVVYLLLMLVGVCMITFTTTANSLVQVQAPNHLRGRVMSIFTLVFAGLSPIGSFLSGSAAHAWGAPVTLGLGAGISLVLVLALVLRNREFLQVAVASE